MTNYSVLECLKERRLRMACVRGLFQRLGVKSLNRVCVCDSAAAAALAQTELTCTPQRRKQ